MPAQSLYAVVTTIQPPTACVEELARRLREAEAPLIVVGDMKGPFQYAVDGAQLYTIWRQAELPHVLSPLLPTGHYARKNLGYLEAIAQGATCIYETDDDNAPSAAWNVRELECAAQPLAPRRWANVYRLFGEPPIWPRGFPLECVNDPATYAHDPASAPRPVVAPIQQGLADGAPDVDAIWRLTLDRPFVFDRRPSVWLPPGTWCPFNSQTTWWWPQAYPLLYLPSFCSFRMTDIWRSFIAQRCLWELGHGLVFHASEAVQERNTHNLMRDFQDELSGHIGNAQIAATLTNLKLRSGNGAVCDNLLSCYQALIADGFFPGKELPLVQAWLTDLSRLTAALPTAS